jgi:uncharacterized membrane protein YoaK (UPF0700 family)
MEPATMAFVTIRWSGVPLAFVAGFVDTATFLRVSELFSAHITGNFVVIAIALVHGMKSPGWVKVVALPGFFVGVLLATFIFDRSHNRIDRVLVLETTLLFAVGSLEIVLHTPAYDPAFAMVLVLAMAFQNAAHQVEPSLGATSVVMTTNAARLFVALWRKLSPPPGGSAQVKAEGIGTRVVMFGIGCVVSAFATHRFGLAAVILPAAIVAWVAIHHHREQNERMRTR